MSKNRLKKAKIKTTIDKKYKELYTEKQFENQLFYRFLNKNKRHKEKA